MKHAIIQNDTPVIYTGKFAIDSEGTQHPLRSMTRAQKLVYGVYEVERDMSVPAGQTMTGTELVLGDSVVLEQAVYEPMSGEQLARRVKAECKRRILAVADAETQQNIAQSGILYSAFRINGMAESEALSQAGLVAGDMTTAAAFRGWVSAMSQAADALIMDGNVTYQDDTYWPAVPDGVTDLAARF